MKTIFIIGGIGSGKSTVTRYFNERGAPTLDLDQVGHEVLSLDEARASLVERFGEDIIGSDRKIDRKALAAKAFVTPAATKTLTDVTATLIVDHMKKWVDEQSPEDHPFVIVEVSAFDGPQGHYGCLASSIIAVTAPIEMRVERAMRNGFSEEDVRHRMSRQVTDGERRSWAQYVVENDGSLEDLRRKLDLLWKELDT